MRTEYTQRMNTLCTVVTFGTGRMYAAFHWFGTIGVAMERLKRRVSGLQKNESRVDQILLQSGGEYPII